MNPENPTNPETEVEEDLTTPETETSEVELDENGDPVQPPEDETEEVEHEGKKYKLPKPLKGALLMQADYTRKTQEVAEQRKQVEERQKAFVEEQKQYSAHLLDIGKLVALKDAVTQFEQANWPQIRANNPAEADQLWFQYQQTKLQFDKSAAALNAQIQERNSKAQQEAATRAEQFRSAVQREIPDWSPELAGKLDQFAISQGFTADELRQVSDPRVVKMIHTAWKASQLQTKQAAIKKAEIVEAAKPLKTVAANTGTRANPADASGDKLSTEEWARRRNAQLAKRRA